MLSKYLYRLTICKPILILSISIGLQWNIIAQNIVINGSFEDYNSCPNVGSNLADCNNWENGNTGTTDYFNSCAPQFTGVGIPKNSLGYQYAKDGNAYVGIGLFNGHISPPEREYAQGQLNETLQIDKYYTVTFYISLAEISDCFIKAMGAYISDDKIFRNDDLAFQYIPQIVLKKENYLTDTLNWMEVTGIYKAIGGEKYITIGNFGSTNDTTCPYNIGSNAAYYYLDGVSIIPCDTCKDTLAPSNIIFIPDAFSPNGDGCNDKLFVRGNNVQELYFAVYDRWGEKVFETTDKNNGWDGSYKGSQLSGAVFVYYCKGKYTDGLEFKQKGDVTLVR
jgi:gliding motility-associated-like protein